jgi:hypothetical protein
VVWIFKDGGHLLRWVRRFDTEQTSKRGGTLAGYKSSAAARLYVILGWEGEGGRR